MCKVLTCCLRHSWYSIFNMLAPIGFNSVIFSLHPSSFIVNPLNYTTMNLLWAHHTLLLSRMCPSLSSGSCGSATQASCRTVPQPLTVSSSSLFLHCSSNPRGSRAPLLYSLSLSSCSLQASGSLDGQAFSSPHPFPSGMLSTMARAHPLPPSVHNFFSLISMFFHLPDFGFCFFIPYSLLKICLPSSSIELPFSPPLI